MRILSIRHTFDADHSSSSYEFFSFDRLTAEQRAAVSELTGESARAICASTMWATGAHSIRLARPVIDHRL